MSKSAQQKVWDMHIRRDLDPGDAVHDKLCSHIGFGVTDVFLSGHTSGREAQGCKSHSPEEKLAVQVADIDRVHVYYMYVLETGQSEIGQDLAAEPTGADHENLAFVPQKVFHL